MRVHVLGIPHTQTSEDFTTCAFTQKALNLCKMLHRRGHEVIHYGVEGSTPECTENISVMPVKTWRTAIGGHPGPNFYNTKVDGALVPYHDLFARNMHAALRSRVGPAGTEIVCQTWGGAQRKACEGIEQFLVESGIGYPQSWADWRVYESYAWLHMHLGRDKLFGGGKWYWAVVPNAFDLKNFTPVDKRSDEFLYLGRLNDDKGIWFAVDAAKEVGRKIRLVGQGSPGRFLKNNPHVTYQPPVGVEDRRKLLAEAYAVFCPTQYVEPFGGVHVEAMMSGTPVITSDFGVFPETVLHGVTGYRCRSMDQFVWAAKNIDRIDGRVCAEWARDNYSLERVALMYEEFFQQILNVRDFHKTAAPPTGFYERFPERTQLDWLLRKYPKAAAETTIDLNRPHEAPVPPPASPPLTEWDAAQKFEADWWGLDWGRHWDEEIQKQRVYCRLMAIDRSDFGDMEILDVGCGPVSLLQRTRHGRSRGVDPLPMSDATKERYHKANVEVLSIGAEAMPIDRTFDEVWMFNCLRHSRDPREILRRIEIVAKAGSTVRIFEWLDTDARHRHNVTEQLFADHFTAPRWKRGIWNVGSISEGIAQGRYIAIVAHATRAHEAPVVEMPAVPEVKTLPPPHLGGSYLDRADPHTWMPDIWERLIVEHDIRSAIDVGCGPGFTTRWLLDRLGDAAGVEGDPAAHAVKQCDPIVQHDYTCGPYLPARTFDLGWASEFVEHVEEQYIPNWMATLARCKFVCITFAMPGQGGYHHVNERDENYWIAQFATYGLEHVPEETARLRATSNGEPYGRKTLTFFRNKRPAADQFDASPHVAVADMPPTMSFVMRVRNEEKTLKASIDSLLQLTIPIELVVVLHRCTDGSAAIARACRDNAPAKHRLKIVEYGTPISRAGLETFITPSTSQHSLVSYYTYAFGLASCDWKFKWDGDHVATPVFRRWIEQKDWTRLAPKVIRMNHRSLDVGGGIICREPFAHNCLRGFAKHHFWEVPVFPTNGTFVYEEAPDDTTFVHASAQNIVKPYWRDPPWFAVESQAIEAQSAEAATLRRRYARAVELVGPEPVGLARSNNPEADAYLQRCLAVRDDLLGTEPE